jgi:HJR/Mrr/RecB family endonuclease
MFANIVVTLDDQDVCKRLLAAEAVSGWTDRARQRAYAMSYDAIWPTVERRG